MKSIWEKSILSKKSNPLDSNVKVNTVVIGAGMAGVLTAFFLQRKGIDVIVVEAKSIASGQTKGTTAKITSQHGLIYNELVRKIGFDRAKCYAMANEEAIHMYESIVMSEGIQCHFEKKDAYLYSLKKDRIEELKREAEVAEKLGIKASFVEGEVISELPFRVEGSVCFRNQAQFNPIEFIEQMSKNLMIYENIKVLKVKEHTVFTNKGLIIADNIVFATHYPITNVPGLYFARQHQERSYVLAIDKQKELSGMYYSVDKNGLSFRSYGDVLMIGGGKHRTGKYNKSNNCGREGYGYLRKMTKRYYAEAKEIGVWSAQDCMSHDRVPFIGKYSMLRPYWYVATGFNKWGMTSSMIAAMVISEYIGGIVDWKAKVFVPQRLYFRASIVGFMKDVFESGIGLVKGVVCDRRHRCSHMGCKLEWNKEEECWECPCHGSRYDNKGEVIDNPAQMDLRCCDRKC